MLDNPGVELWDKLFERETPVFLSYFVKNSRDRSFLGCVVRNYL